MSKPVQQTPSIVYIPSVAYTGMEAVSKRASRASQSRESRADRRLGKAVHARLPTRADGVRRRSRHASLVIFLPVRHGHRRSYFVTSHAVFSTISRRAVVIRKPRRDVAASRDSPKGNEKER